jgi:RNA polymerase sigma factor (sigma-70 family)
MHREKTVLVVDDEPEMRSALVRLFRSEGLEVEAYGTAREFLEVWRRGDGACLVLDLMMPQMSGLQLLEQLRASGSQLPVLFLTGAADVRVAVEAMRAGATDFLEKPFDNAVLVQRVRQAMHLGDQRRAGAMHKLAIEQRIATLSPREREVMDLVVEGMSTRQIAAHLNLSGRTVEVHRARIMEKMEANTLADLVRSALTAKG